MKIKLLLLSQLFFAWGLTQNWLPFDTAKVYNFKSDGGAFVERAIGTWQDGDTTFFHTIVDFCYTCVPDTLKARQPDIFGFYFLNTFDSVYTFYGNDTFTIKPLKSIGQTWQYNSTNTAEIIEVYTDTFDLQLDSLKKVWLGNTDTLILSKEHGIIQFPDFQRDTLFIQEGIEGNYGFQNLNFWDVYNFNVGDMFQYSYSQADADGNNNYSQRYKIKILDKVVLPEGIEYYVKKWLRHASQVYIPGTNQTQLGYSYTITFENINYYDSSETILNMNLGQWLEIYERLDPLLISSYYQRDNEQILSKVYSLPPYLEPFFPIDGFIVEHWSGDYCYLGFRERRIDYKVGLGKTLDAGSFFEHGRQLKLLGYYKGIDTIGTIHNDEFYINGLHDLPIENFLSFYPNPAQSKVFLDLKDNTELTIKLFDMQGKEVFNDQFKSDSYLDVSHLSKGLYIIEVENKEGKSAHSKLVIE